MSTTPQDRLLAAIEDPETARILDGFYQKVQGAPLEAAKLLRTFEQMTQIVAKATTDIPESWAKLDDLMLESEIRKSQFVDDLRKFRKDLLDEVKSAAESIASLKTSLVGIDDNLLNKANRIVELCEKLGKAKKDGSLDILKQLVH